MPNLIVFEPGFRDYLLPLAFSRPVGDLRIGVLTVREKWERYLGIQHGSFLAHPSLRKLYPTTTAGENLLVNGGALPTKLLADQIAQLRIGQGLRSDGELIAAKLSAEAITAFAGAGDLDEVSIKYADGPATSFLRRPHDIFTLNDAELRRDFQLITQARQSEPVSETNTIIGPADQLFIEPGATLEACTLNLNAGPIYVGRDAVVLEGCLLRGAISIGEGAVLKMGAKIYGATTIGPKCKVGGEVNNVVFHGNSNKGHEGYLGNAVIGRWCNIGADTNASNLKNNYGEVKVWSYATERSEPTSLQFHGLVMGDHSKIGINTMLNTGAVIGFSANVYGAGFPPTFIPSFSWGGAAGFTGYRLDKAIETARRVIGRRGQTLTDAEAELFSYIHAYDARYRNDG